MSLRLRLILLTAVLVAVVALSLSWLYLQDLADSLTSEAVDRSDLTSLQIRDYLTDHVEQELRDYPPPATVAEVKINWGGIVATDLHIAGVLPPMMAGPRTFISEINIAAQDGTIIVSTNPGRLYEPLRTLEPVADLRKGSSFQRIVNLVSERPDRDALIPIGVAGDTEPIVTIQVVTSNALLRQLLLPRLKGLQYVGAGTLLATMLLAVVATRRALQPIHRIEETIDRIASGVAPDENRNGNTSAAKEFRVMESKLNLLGQQLRGVRQDASQLRNNVDQLLDRVATELDVATRLTAISKLTSGVAHEIKNPLNAIVLRLDLLRERLGEPEEELRKEIDILSKEALRLDRVVKTFLDFSRPVEVHLQEVDLGALAREVMDLLAPQAKAAKIESEFTAPASPAIVRGDPDMLKQAVLNLATNAMEAMQSGGKLRVSVVAEKGKVRLEVADTGPGIPPELRAKVFQLYFTTKSKGTGIGLALTFRAVQLHNGTIQFTSEPGQGTTFHLEFPPLVRSI